MIDWVEHIDRELFLWLNGMHQPWLDQLMYYMTEALFWIPVYILLLWLIAKNFSKGAMFWSLLAIALIVTLSDRISVEVFKEVVQRYRPSRNLEIGPMVHLVNDYRGGLYGFVSSHATNFFGIATFLFLLLRKAYPRGAWLILLWATLISYTRIYLGVHYPLDIIGGGMLGATIGTGVFLLFQRYILNRS